MNTRETEAALAALTQWYQTLDEAALQHIEQFYAQDAWFKDPFHELSGSAAIRAVFQRMFAHLQQPRFEFHERIVQGNQAFVTWSFHFGVRGKPLSIRGSSHLRFCAPGRVHYHRDYWDVAEELLARVPGLGWMYNTFLKRMV